MADFINISTQKLRDTADKFQTLNKQMDDDLNKINQTMKSLESTWKSDAGVDIRANMEKLAASRFDQYKTVVDEYKKFLLRTADSYEQTEEAIQNNASQFK